MSAPDGSALAAYRELKRDLAWFIVWIFAVMALLAFAGAMGWSPDVDDTDLSPRVRSGMVLRTDHGTGCQYLEAAGGGITPRLRPDGKPLCAGGVLR